MRTEPTHLSPVTITVEAVQERVIGSTIPGCYIDMADVSSNANCTSANPHMVVLVRARGCTHVLKQCGV